MTIHKNSRSERVCSLNRTQACNERRQTVRVVTKLNHRIFGKLQKFHVSSFQHFNIFLSPPSHTSKIITNQRTTYICKYTHRKADKFLVIAFHTPKDLLTVTAQFIQFFFNDSCIHRLSFLNELLTLQNYLLNFVVVQWNFLLESLHKRKACALSMKSTLQQPKLLRMQVFELFQQEWCG